MKEKRYITLDEQLKNWKTKNSYHDILKFQMIYRNKSAHITQETHDLKIESALKVFNDFPGVRFYGFHNSAKEFGVKNYYFDAEDYDSDCGIPDGYLFSEDYGIFIIEIENTSRVTKQRLGRYSWWWSKFDNIDYTPIYIMEFNRFGVYQRDLLRESGFDRPSDEILREACGKLKKDA
jgi:hypothetical protein